jgi:hypothetical protein
MGEASWYVYVRCSVGVGNWYCTWVGDDGKGMKIVCQAREQVIEGKNKWSKCESAN